MYPLHHLEMVRVPMLAVTRKQRHLHQSKRTLLGRPLLMRRTFVGVGRESQGYCLWLRVLDEHRPFHVSRPSSCLCADTLLCSSYTTASLLCRSLHVVQCCTRLPRRHSCRKGMRLEKAGLQKDLICLKMSCLDDHIARLRTWMVFVSKTALRNMVALRC